MTVPINVQSATEDHSIRFRQYHLEDMGRVRVRKICELEDREVSSTEIGKGYEWVKASKDTAEQIIPISEEELGQLPLPTAKALEIAAFVPLESIDPIRIAEGYYLQPSSPIAGKPYKLLVQALGRSSKVAVAKYSWSGRERLGLIRVKDDALVLHAMRWPDEIRDPSSLLPPSVELSDEELQGALALMDTMTRDDLEGPEFHDQYTEAIAQIIEAKRDEKPLPEAPEPEQPGQVLDLMAALQESVEKSKAARGENTGSGAVHELPKKKAATKKTAKKQPAKKTAAKQAGRKPRSA